MTISVQSWNGHDLASGSYVALLEMDERPFTNQVRNVLTQSPGSWPRQIRTDAQARSLTLHVQIQPGVTLNSAQRELSQWFAVSTEGELVIDEDGTSKALDCVVIQNGRFDRSGAEFSATLIAADPRWRGATPTTAGGALSASGQSVIVTNPGNITDDQAIITLRPTVAKAAASGYLYRVRPIVAWRSTRESGYYAIELTNGGWDHATEVGAGRSQSDGDDIRVLVDGIEIPRWLGEHANNDANSALTTVWANISWQACRSATLLAAATAILPEQGGDLEVVRGGTSQWPQSGAILLDDEVILYTGISKSNANGREAFTGITRGAWNTTAAAHSASTVMYWIEHEIEIVYGNTGVSAPDSRADLKPLLDLTQATPAALSNVIHAWINFADDTYPGRSMQWRRKIRSFDDQWDKVLAPGGSPASNLTFEYQSAGAVSGKPASNAWFRDLPTGTGSSGGNVASLTRTLSDTMGMWLYGVDDAGQDVVLQKFAGALSSASANIAAPTNPVYRLECWAFNQVVARRPDVGVGYSLSYDPDNSPDGVQILVGDQPLEIVAADYGILDSTGGTDVTGRLAVDSGSDVPTGTIGDGTYTTTNAGFQRALATYSPAPILQPNTKYWVCLLDDGGAAPPYWEAATTPPPNGLYSRRGGTNRKSECWDFRLFGRPYATATAFVRTDDNSVADDGDTVVVDGVTVYLSSSTTPYVSLKARESIYRVQGSLYNETTGQSLTVDALCRLSDQLEIDVAAAQCVNGSDGDSPVPVLTFSDPDQRFELAPGANNLTWIESGCAGMDLAVASFGRWE